MKSKLALVLLAFIFINMHVNAQKENNKWYFGDFAGLDFSTNSPTRLFSNGLLSTEGSASMYGH